MWRLNKVYVGSDLDKRGMPWVDTVLLGFQFNPIAKDGGEQRLAQKVNCVTATLLIIECRHELYPHDVSLSMCVGSLATYMKI